VSDVFAVPLDEPSWTFEPQAWLDAVRERWPAAQSQLGGYPNEPTAAVALLPADARRLEVVLHSDRRSVAFEPLIPDAIAEFVAWWAERLPAYDPPVHLFMGGDADHSLPLTRDLAVADVLRFLAQER
jgi:hypothetical protein